MIHVKFKNLEPSELARSAATERLAVIVDKFTDLASSKLQVTLEMENSPFKAGPDSFKAKVFVSSGRYRGLVLEKSNENLYVALADLADHLPDRLNRFGDRERVKMRKITRSETSI